MKISAVHALAAIAGLLLTGGCESSGLGDLFGKKKNVGDEPTPEAAGDTDPLFRDTVGYYTLFSGASGLRVRGFGIVTNLGKNGSSDCPSAIREYLLDFMSREYMPTGPGTHRRKFSPQKLIEDESTAVVEVMAVIPAGAPRGTIIDLQVEAIAGTATRSLEGGLLAPCELRIFDVNASGTGILQGRVAALASGPIFVNPFEGGSATGNQNPRRGFVLGGGRTSDERTVQLQLVEPSYPLARRLERAINERFGQRPKAAEAMSQGYLLLHTPREYKDDPDQFLTLVPYCSMQAEGGFKERKFRDLLTLAETDSREMERISLAWEALGENILPLLRDQYASRDEGISFYAARAGLRLGDSQALSLMEQVARSSRQPYSNGAVKEIAKSKFQYAGDEIVPLLSGDNTSLRVAAYESLANMGHPAIDRKIFRNVLDRMQPNVIFDQIDTTGTPIIYFRRTHTPRLALLGDRVRVKTPMYYADADETVTITSKDEPGKLTLFARGREDRLSEKIVIPADVESLVMALAEVPVFDRAKNLRGLGQPYAKVVQVLAELAEQGMINAKIVPEQIGIDELLGPTPFRERAPSDAMAKERFSPRAGQGRSNTDNADAPAQAPDSKTEIENYREKDSLWND
ncbi:MAG: flagellar basal body P-ring protein FlgI [Phycisphaerae bacterium]